MIYEIRKKKILRLKNCQNYIKLSFGNKISKKEVLRKLIKKHRNSRISD